MKIRTTSNSPSLNGQAVGSVNYQALLRDYSSLSMNTSAKTRERTDDFNINDVMFTFYYQPQVTPGLFYIRCEVLDIEDNSDIQLVPQLLTENMSRYHQHKPVFALSPDMKRVIALLNLPLHKADKETLDGIVQDMARDVREWRNTMLSNDLSASDTDKARSPMFGADAQFPMTPNWEMTNVAR